MDKRTNQPHGPKPEPTFEPSDYSEVWLGKNPTPHERADLIVKRLEQFIREGGTEQGGVAFKKWQELAVDEVSNAIRDAEKHWRADQRFVTRGLTIGAATLLTIGIWGTILAADAAPDRQTAALILIIAGGVMLTVLGFWGVRRLDNYYQVSRRRDHITRVWNFDRQLAQLDKDLENRLKELEESLEEMAKGKLGDL